MLTNLLLAELLLGVVRLAMHKIGDIVWVKSGAHKRRFIARITVIHNDGVTVQDNGVNVFIKKEYIGVPQKIARNSRGQLILLHS